MRVSILRMVPLLAILALATATTAATVTPGLTPPTPESSPAATAPPSAERSPTFVPSPSMTPRPRRTTVPTASPDAAADAVPDVDPTPVAEPDAEADEASRGEMPLPESLATPAGPVRGFRTPDREAPPAFVAPRLELPEGEDDTQVDEPGTEALPPPDLPYIATVTFRASASTEIDGFDLLVIYPRAAGDFVGHRNGVECRKTVEATLFADDHEDGMLQLLVASSRPLPFPFEIVCKFTVEPNASLTPKLIAVNVVQVTAGRQPAEAAALTVTVSAR